MSRFQPARASPPLKPSVMPAVALARDLLNDSHSSAVSTQELAGLTPNEVEFIDTVIDRASATSTTFLSVFKAYNDVLHERGLDPQNEVLYYGKLLKLGTLKGANWGEKWAAVKQQHGYGTGRPPTQDRRVTRVSRNAPISTRLTTGLVDSRPEDTLTLHSHQDDTESVYTTRTADPGTPQYHQTPRPTRRAVSPAFTSVSNSLGLDTGPPAAFLQSRATPSIVPSRRPPAFWDGENSEVTVDTAPTLSTTPPSYGAATRDTIPIKHIPYTPFRFRNNKESIRAASASPPPAQITPAQRIQQVKERRNSVLKEEDAWAKIKDAQDEKEADRFREDKLLERCWDVWKQGYQWIVTTHEQIAEARDTLILRIALQRWRERTAARYDLYKRVSSLADNRRLKLAFHVWKLKLKEKRQSDWRNEMRAKMKIVRETRENKLLKDAWAKWRQSHQSHLSDQHFSEKLVLRFFRKWKKKYRDVDDLDAVAEHFAYGKEQAQVEKCWDLWRRALEMRKAEAVMAERVGLRIMGGVMDVWKRRMHENQIADDFYDRVLVKRSLGSWKAAKDRIRALEQRATKHVGRQNDLLVRAVMRVWKAHERGKLMERVKSVRLLKRFWTMWKSRVENEKTRQDVAIAFSLRATSTVASSALAKWRSVYTTHRNALSFAGHYHSAQLNYKTLLVWRLRLRANLSMVKKAKVAQKQFIVRNCWKRWMIKVQDKKREKKLREFETQVAKQFFREWMARAQQQRQQKLAEEIIKQRISLRIMSQTLTHWTTRVADIKFRELEVNQKVEKALLVAAFGKWKALCMRHVEELSLMESYQDVKREELVRRMFIRWLSAARTVRHRRLVLQQKEEEMKLTVIASAWDKWRERFQDIRLQPIADQFLVQRQKDAVFRAFGIWHSKTHSLPAVRFHASRTKLKFWKTWRDAMPKALQAKAAREFDQKSVLSKAFSKWTQAYKTKIDLKAVARARYLRLPTSAPRRSLQPSLTTSQTPLMVPYKATRPLNETPSPSTTAFPRTAPSRFGIASLLSTRSRSPDRGDRPSTEPKAFSNKTRPKLSSRGSTTRDSSPTRAGSTFAFPTRRSDDITAAATRPASEAGTEGHRTGLWQEIRQVQRRSRSRAPTERSESREPP